ncbi:protein of unknown function [Mycolicibacterium rutilum]|uniref:DUF202 domain-containing protein n=1 Tax=Mycolicibacterium rutilum TaxID=370526 RepID=A0A1H6J587_MYCRU|nr:DUF202 domain-containing protein [Mycolicibacterium rutilum]SEH55892.1 protein of unknown function [Mycolicibacterium rutilum]
MTREALAQDRGLQAERTDLAWARTSLAALVAGGLLLAREHGLDQPSRVNVGVAALVCTAAVFLIGVRRRRALAARPLAVRVTARRQVFCAGAAVLILGALVITYLALPLF